MLNRDQEVTPHSPNFCDRVATATPSGQSSLCDSSSSPSSLLTEAASPALQVSATRKRIIHGKPTARQWVNHFPWMSEAMDLKKQQNFFEIRVIESPSERALAWN